MRFLRLHVHSSMMPGIFLFIFAAVFPEAAFAQSQINTIILNTITVIQYVTTLAMTLALAMFAFGIVKMIAASGNPQKIEQAKNIMLWGIIGLFVMASITGFIALGQRYFGVAGGGQITPPQF